MVHFDQWRKAMQVSINKKQEILRGFMYTNALHRFEIRRYKNALAPSVTAYHCNGLNLLYAEPRCSVQMHCCMEGR
jgi:hypothetical protein